MYAFLRKVNNIGLSFIIYKILFTQNLQIKAIKINQLKQ